MQFEWKLDLNFVLAALALFVTCLFFYVQSRREQRGLKREIYQRVELASNELFRFEADHLEILECFNSTRNCPEDSREYRALIAYVTQVLNLFEMAVRFREQKIMPDDVFGSWVIWFYDVCSAANFPAVWNGALRFNYLPELREIMTAGVAIITESGDNDAAKQKFFEFVATKYRDPDLANWLKE